MNVLANPGFEDGTGSWTYAFDGTGAFTSDSTTPYSGSKRAKCTCVVKGTYSQLYQINFPFVANTKYRISFAAYSSSGVDMDVAIAKHVTPFTNYGLVQTVNLTTGWQLFTYDFTSSATASTDARLYFNFQPYVNNGDIYYIDQVNLQKVSEINGQMFALF